MQINSYILSSKEENKILDIWYEFKKFYNKCKIYTKNDMIIISEPNKSHICSISYIGNKLVVHFKNNDEEFDIYDESINITILKTIKLFELNEFIRLTKKNKSKSIITKPSSHLNSSIKIIRKKLANLLYKNKYDDLSFDFCSTRLRNRLYQKQIYNIKILKSYPIESILKFKNFGKKSLCELCEFLENAQNNDIINLKDSANFRENFNSIDNHILENQNHMLININKINIKTFNFNSKNSFSLYLKFTEQYSRIYLDLLNVLSKISLFKLTPREQAIFNSRFGINEENKTLQQIGNLHNLTRERVRQITNDIKNKIKTSFLTNTDSNELSYLKCDFIDNLSKISIEGFFTYIFYEYKNLELLKFLYCSIFNREIDITYLKKYLERQKGYHTLQMLHEKYAKNHNEKIYNLIQFDKKNIISDAKFARLKTERTVNGNDEDLIYFSYNNRNYQCESLLEKEILKKLLKYNTFKQIKTQSLKIPFHKGFYYPDFQCLTHDNYLVIIEVKPLFNMCEYPNIKKFHKLKSYCEKHGYGYLIIDEKFNSFFHINNNNETFNTLITDELDKHNHIYYLKYKEISNTTNATIQNLLTLIKNTNLKLYSPFMLIR